MSDLIDRQAAIDVIKEFQHGAAEWRDEQEERSDIWHRADSAIASAIEIKLRVKKLPSAQPDENMIHLQKEQAYMAGWEDGREAQRKELIYSQDAIKRKLNLSSLYGKCVTSIPSPYISEDGSLCFEQKNYYSPAEEVKEDDQTKAHE